MKLEFIYSEDCNKCHFLRPFVEAFAEREWIKMKCNLWNESEYKVDSVPMLAVITKEEVKMLNDAEIVEFINNYHKDE